MRHLVRAGRHLLHDEERESHEAEAVTEIFEHDGRADQHGARRLEPRQQRVDHERNVEDADQREQGAPQFEPRNEIAAQNGPHDEGDHAERTVIESDLLFGKAHALLIERSVEEQRHDLDDQTFGEAVEEDEGEIDPDVFLLEELQKDALRLAHGAAETIGVGRRGAARRQHADVVQPKQEENAAAKAHHGHPRLHDSDMVLERAGQIDQSAHGEDLSDVVKGALPADELGLQVFGKFGDIDAVGGDVVRRAAEGHDSHQGDGIGEKVGKRKRQGDQRKSQTRNQLRGDDPEFLGPEHLHQGTPEGFERPRQDNQRSPERNAGIVDTQPSEHQRRYHVYDNKREPHGKIDRGDPCQRRYFSGICRHRFFSG